MALDHFLKSTGDIKPIDMRKNITDTTWGISLNRQVTLGYFKIEMEI